MDAAQDEFLLACYRHWARDAGLSEIEIQMVEYEARRRAGLAIGHTIAERFYALICRLVENGHSPDLPE
jgi:hypothetical protein